MKKILWVMNKYVSGGVGQDYYPYFLKYTQDDFKKYGLELHFVYFSSLFKKNAITTNNHFYNPAKSNVTADAELESQAARIERDYNFTFKQAWFPDLIQVSKEQNSRKISVPEYEFNDLDHLVKKFLYLEQLINDESIDVLFSDVSPEVEMEFARAIGLKLNIPVLKAYEGAFLGRSVILQSKQFGKYCFIETEVSRDITKKDAENFISDYVTKEGVPLYLNWKKNNNRRSIYERTSSRLKRGFKEILTYPWSRLLNTFYSLYLWFESAVMKKFLYADFDPDQKFLFFGFHLNQESTMGLRSLPYVNQTALIEMLSRVLPYGYTLYVREHPHWPKTFPYNYLKTMKKLPNVRILSPRISIHKILRNASGVLVYNSNTGHEALMYGKPVLSFASNLYYERHPAVLYCDNLYLLGEKLVELINTKVNPLDTENYIYDLFINSIDFGLGSNLFTSKEDALARANDFSHYFSKCLVILN